MKKLIISFILASVITTSFCACHPAEKATNTSDSTLDVSTTTEAETDTTVKDETKATEVETDTTVKTETKTADSQNILKAYKDRLVENIYHYNDSRADELPTYALFDFDGDGTAELLVWDIRVASAAFRDIYVYRYNTVTGKAEHIGTMVDFTGHSVITEARDGKGIVIAIRDAGQQDKITEYSLIDGRLAPSVLLARNDETSQEWNDKIVSPEYNSGVTLETANTYDVIEKEFP